MKTLTGTPDQPRPRNEPVWTNSTKTTAGEGGSGGNMRIDWAGLNAQRVR